MAKISKRLLHIVDELPLKDGIRMLEIGCGSGVAAREILNRTKNTFILAIDRSEKAIAQAVKQSALEVSSGRLKLLKVAIEELNIKNEPLYDFAYAIRVGALDGRHPELESIAKERIKAILKPGGKLYMDGGNPILEIKL